jgi:serine/threonine protein kinase
MELLSSDTGTVSSIFPVEELTRENLANNSGSFSAPVQLHPPDGTPPRPYGRLSSDLYSFIQTSTQYSSPPSEEVIRIIVAQLAEAILFLHANGYVHRDIKDENIMVDSNYKVTLIDLGAADRIPSARDEYFTSFRGTFRYHVRMKFYNQELASRIIYFSGSSRN